MTAEENNIHLSNIGGIHVGGNNRSSEARNYYNLVEDRDLMMIRLVVDAYYRERFPSGMDTLIREIQELREMGMNNNNTE